VRHSSGIRSISLVSNPANLVSLNTEKRRTQFSNDNSPEYAEAGFGGVENFGGIAAVLSDGQPD
jgi:hypothetical protein